MLWICSCTALSCKFTGKRELVLQHYSPGALLYRCDWQESVRWCWSSTTLCRHALFVTVLHCPLQRNRCAAFSAFILHAGKRVLVLEQHYTAGGFTHAFARGPYAWNVGVHYIGNFHVCSEHVARFVTW
jgi:hypothetical protein